MRIFLSHLYLTIFVLIGNLSFASPQDFHIGQHVVLQAKKPIGIPLHPEAFPSYLKHIPSGSTVIIHGIAQDGHWLNIRLDSGDTSWVHKKYVQASTATPIVPSKHFAKKALADSKITLGGEEQVWTNKTQCQAAVQKGLRMVEASSEKLRVATWNLRWFPVGTSPDRPDGSAEPTDIEWLICVIRWMQVDILAIQESLGTSEATQAWKTLTSQLSQKTGQIWRWYRQPCGRPDDHHIGLLWNDTRVSLSDFDSLWQFNAKAQSPQNPCAFGLRPGQYAYAQSREVEGVDFHLIALHLKSGPTVFAVEKRQKALNRIDETMATYVKRDRDIVILGDFNTMGAGDFHSQRSERKYVHRLVAKEKPGFTDLNLQPQCSHYFRGRGGWLDHVLVAKGMQEVTANSARVTGYCALAGCQRIRGDYPRAYRLLSDHCPVILEIENRDED